MVTSLVTSPAPYRLTCANTGTGWGALAICASDGTRSRNSLLTRENGNTESIRFGQSGHAVGSSRGSLSRSTYALNWENPREWANDRTRRVELRGLEPLASCMPFMADLSGAVA